MKKIITVKISPKNKGSEYFLKTTKKELDSFFNLNVPEPIVFLLDSRKELDLIWRHKTWRYFYFRSKNLY